MAYLIDTGILLRLFEQNDPHHPFIREALRNLIRRGEPLVTAVQNIAEFWNVSTRPVTARGGYGHTVARVQRRVAIIERFCEVLAESDTSYAQWKRLVGSHEITGVAVHDARLVALMHDRAVTHLLTLNCADFARYTHVTAVLPIDV